MPGITRLLFKLILIVSILIAMKLPFVARYEDEVAHRQAALFRDAYDTILIGSSRTQFGVKPAYLDTLNGNKTKTYNFGVAWGILPQTIDWCEVVIGRHKSLRYILFELSGSGGLAREFAEPWVEFRLKDYVRAVQSFSFRKSSAYHDELALGFLKPQLPATKYFDNNTPHEQLHEADSFQDAKIALSELAVIQRRNATVEKGNANITADPDTLLWQRIVGLIHLADSAGIQIYFFIPPRLQTDSELLTVHRLWHRLDERRRLHVDHAAEALYTVENSADIFHLNHRGAIRFTEHIAAAFHPEQDIKIQGARRNPSGSPKPPVI